MTAVNGPADNTWQNALRRGDIRNPARVVLRRLTVGDRRMGL